MKKILIIGAKGMLGQELVKLFSADSAQGGPASGGKNYEVVDWDKEEIDITDEAQVKDKVGALAPEIIINAAAYNAVDRCEELVEFEKAKKINGLAPGHLARIAKKIKISPNPASPAGRPSFLRGEETGAIFVHYSTDYVFDGQKIEGYKENDFSSPLSNYGRSKLLGETEVQRVGGKFYLIRLQRLFGLPAEDLAKAGRPARSAGAKKSFFEAMLNLAQTRKEIEAVDEELANFTFAPDLAERTKWLVEGGNNINLPHPNPLFNKERERFSLYPFGIYHVTNEGKPVTWFGAAKILFELTEYKDIKLIPVPSSRFPRPAKRPKYSILINTKLPPLRRWTEALEEFLKEF